MPTTAAEILAILDQCCDAYTFPMLDNGYVYLAATRLSLFRSSSDWAMVIEVFGFSPRAGLPDTHVHTFASRLHQRKTVEQFVSADAFEAYLSNNPHNESSFVHPIETGPWQDADCVEVLAPDAKHLRLRGLPLALPSRQAYEVSDIPLEDPEAVHVFETCRYLARQHREQVLATEQERRRNIHPDLEQVLQLEEWHHPDVVDDDERPSGSDTFQQFASILAGADTNAYQPPHLPNTHWRNWPNGGTL